MNTLFYRTKGLDAPFGSRYVKCKTTGEVPKIKYTSGSEKAEILLAVSASSHYS